MYRSLTMAPLRIPIPVLDTEWGRSKKGYLSMTWYDSDSINRSIVTRLWVLTLNMPQ